MGTTCAGVARPLLNLLEDGAEWIWDPEQEKSFQELIRVGLLTVELMTPRYDLA